MISNYMDAYKALGLNGNVTREQWKTAYRNICKMYHPDNYKGKDGIAILQNACEAYDFLENQYAIGMQAQIKPRIIGNPSVKKKDDVRKYKEVLKQNEKAEKERQQKKLQERIKELKLKEQKERQEKILDEIRWLRVAEIVRNTIHEDIERKNLENKMYEAIKNAQENNEY